MGGVRGKKINIANKKIYRKILLRYPRKICMTEIPPPTPPPHKKSHF